MSAGVEIERIRAVEKGRMATEPKPESGKHVVVVLILIVALYIASVVAGWPQRATDRIAAKQSESVAVQQVPGAKPGKDCLPRQRPACPPLWMILPFAILLVSIAVLPLIPHTSHWWDSNLHKFYVAGGLGLLSLAYYLFICRQPVVGHWPVDYIAHPAIKGLNWHVSGTILSNSMLNEYVPFIVLLFSLYTITSGIRIEGDLRAHPLTNTTFLAVGIVLASLIGTTGAAMLLIRPLLETNRERKHVHHTVIMFIFAVCNCGGCLLPLGPPLFIGYLFGVPFLWTLKLWRPWLLVNALLLVVYFLWDHFWYYPREAIRDIQRDETEVQPLQFRGIWPNAFLLVGVILSSALFDPNKTIPGTNWHPWVFLREAVQVGLIVLSLCWTRRAIRQDNNFNYGAILEVAVLFLGIFICMQAPLQIVNVWGASLGLTTPAHFFWASGSLSSVLDNAPTYAVFFEAAHSLGGNPAVAGVQESLLVAISLGSSFMGAMTYIGNGPNFMVKSIAEKSGVPMPSFFGYMVYSFVILLPILALVGIWLL